MPNDPSPSAQGRSTFLERAARSLATAAGDEPPAGDPTPPTPPAGDPAPPAAPPADPLAGLAPEPTPPARPPSGDPLDTLDDDPPEPKPTAKPTDGDPPAGDPEFLSGFDPEDQDRIRTYIDEQVAEQVTATRSAGSAFKTLKAENRELRTQLEAARTAEPDGDALAEATRRITELEAQVAAAGEVDNVTRLRETQAYKDAVTNPVRDILAASDKIAERYGVDPDKLARALELTDPRQLSREVAELLGDDAAEVDKFEVYDLARKVAAVDGKRRELVDNAEKALAEAEQLATRRKDKEALQARQGREQAFEATVGRIKEKAKFIVELVGDEGLEAARSAVLETPTEALGAEEQAYARFASAALIPLARRVKALERELQEASDELTARRGASPAARGGAGTQTPESDPKEDTRPFAERVASAIQQGVGA